MDETRQDLSVNITSLTDHQPVSFNSETAVKTIMDTTHL